MVTTQNKILSIPEIRQVVKYHKTGGRRLNSPAVQLRFAIFRLSCCAGLRVSEITGLNLSDFHFNESRPYLIVRKETTKGHRKPGSTEVVRKSRRVGIFIDTETVEDLKRWYQFRLMQSNGDMNAPFICGQTLKNVGKRIDRSMAAKLWKTSLRVLKREKAPSIHCGRHTCISQLVWADYPLTFVRDFAGHSNISITSRYLHSVDEELLGRNAFQV